MTTEYHCGNKYETNNGTCIKVIDISYKTKVFVKNIPFTLPNAFLHNFLEKYMVLLNSSQHAIILKKLMKNSLVGYSPWKEWRKVTYIFPTQTNTKLAPNVVAPSTIEASIMVKQECNNSIHLSKTSPSKYITPCLT